MTTSPWIFFSADLEGCLLYSDAGTCAAVICSVLVLAILFLTRTFWKVLLACLDWSGTPLDLCSWAIFNSMVMWHHVHFSNARQIQFNNRFWITSFFPYMYEQWLIDYPLTCLPLSHVTAFVVSILPLKNMCRGLSRILAYFHMSYDHMSTWAHENEHQFSYDDHRLKKWFQSCGPTSTWDGKL